MGKNSFFTGQPIFSQVLSLIPRSLVKTIARNFKGDHYCKRFDTFHHLVSILFAVFNQCTSLREITTGLLAWEHRLKHLGLSHFICRATLSDANNRRTHEIFEAIYYQLLSRYSRFLPDSRQRTGKKPLYIIDATVITLFSEVLRGTGRQDHHGRRKGGIKATTLMRSDQDVPCMVHFSEAKDNDSQFLKLVRLPKGSVIVFDRGYHDFKTYNRLDQQGITWVTRRRNRTTFDVISTRKVEPDHAVKGIVSDQETLMGNDIHANAVKVKTRLILYKDPATGHELEFLTNNFRLSPLTVAHYYKKRWQIELLFKRLKQNFPLKYFLGESQNAIKIQIWCALIADLLLKVIKNTTKTTLSFSNLVSMVRLHMMTYLDLKTFLRASECQLKRIFKARAPASNLPTLFST